MTYTFSEYQKEAEKSALYKNVASIKDPLFYLTLGLVGETGEVAERIKKLYRDRGGKVDEEWINLMKKELGDVLWYLSQLSSELNIEFDEVAETNIKKLATRKENNTLHGNGDNR